MKQNQTIGIDFGSNTIKIVLADTLQTEVSKIIANIESPAHGFKQGYIVDQEKASESLHVALVKLAKGGFKCTQARIALGGVGLKSQYVRTSLDEIKNNEINERHVNEIIEKAESLFSEKYPNKKILHIIPIKYKVDGRDVLGAPIGMYGNNIEVKVIFVTILEHHYDAIMTILEQNNIDVIDSIASPIADAAVSIDYKQQSQGCMIANIGSETTSFSTFENGTITSLDVIPIGSNDITNDIALGLQISLEEAEKIKLGGKNDYPKRKIEEIIHARLADILESADKHLIKIKKSRLLPAGIIFTGGGSHVEHINDYAKSELKLPSMDIILNKTSRKTKRNLRVPNQFSVAYGLCSSDSGRSQGNKKITFKKIKKTLGDFINQITP